MVWRNKKRKKIDLSSIQDSKKVQVIKEIREKLQEKIMQEKLLRSLLKTETVTINGKVICQANEPLKGFRISTNY